MIADINPGFEATVMGLMRPALGTPLRAIGNATGLELVSDGNQG